jgi:flagella basal body P-ring formation protein FlgA
MTLHPRLAWPVLVLAFVAMSAVAARSEDIARTDADSVGQAIARAVAERVGGDARVSVVKLQTSVSSDELVVASPEPGARTGAPARFTLFAGGSRLGSAVATVNVSARHVRARRSVARSEELTAEDVEEVDGPFVDELLRRVPALDDVIGARARRNLVSGEALTASDVDVPPVVRTGDAVQAIVRIGAVEAEGRAVASGSGNLGDIVRVTPPGTRRTLKARIIGPGKVEIVQ